MQKNKLLIAVILIIVPFFLNGQQLLKGTVYNNKTNNNQPIPGAIIGWMNSTIVSSSNENGEFEIQLPDSLPASLITRLSGFVNDTLIVNDGLNKLEIKLKELVELQSVEIDAKRTSTEISTLKTRNVEVLGETELLKAACCNLSESFETNPTVDVNYSDAITGAKEIHMLGLSGIYTQFLAEAIPTLRGLAVPYGLNYIPGSWMKSIQISRGAGSVSNGYEAITGQINVEFKKPEDTPKLFFNVFGDSQGRTELNTVFNKEVATHLSNILFLHGSMRNSKLDHNDDGFLDLPKFKQINIYNKLEYYDHEKLEAQLGIKALYEDRTGGQLSYNPAIDKGTTNAYGFDLVTKRIEINTKTGLVYPETPWKSMGLQTAFTYHDQNSFYGLKKYDANQTSFYANYSLIGILNSTINKYKVGTDFKNDLYRESLNDSMFSRLETVPGVFAEYTFSNDSSKFGAIIGSRVDYHNLFGWLFAPRIHLKYNFTPEFIIRISGGRGFRTPNLYSDNQGLLLSSKQLIVVEKPQLEDAWNGGLNATLKFRIHERESSLSLDFYRTDFINQLIVDQYTRQDAVLYYNLNGSSTANSFQTTFTIELIDRLNLRLSYKRDDVKTDFIAFNNIQRPMVARNKALANLSYKTEKELWWFDATLQWEGTKNLPATTDYTHNHDAEINYDKSAPDKSPSFFLLNSQITRVFRKFEAYIGGENLLNFTQHDPIIGTENPFGNTFDATRVWGPIMGAMVYGGIRVSIQ